MNQPQGSSMQLFERVDLSEWQVEELRLTAFPASDDKVQFGGWWESVFLGPPDTRTSEPAKETHTDEGAFGEGKLTFRVTPGRLDWLLQCTESQVDRLPVLGDFAETLEVFCELMSRWFQVEGLPELQRLAFGAVLLLPVPDHETGYQQLQAYLHSVTLDPTSSDLLYQINRRRDSDRIPELSINRLSKWSVVRPAPLFRIGPDRIPRVLQAEHYACRLEIDINTVPGLKEPLNREQARLIFGDLVGLGQEIIREGDIQ